MYEKQLLLIKDQVNQCLQKKLKLEKIYQLDFTKPTEKFKEITQKLNISWNDKLVLEEMNIIVSYEILKIKDFIFSISGELLKIRK